MVAAIVPHGLCFSMHGSILVLSEVWLQLSSRDRWIFGGIIPQRHCKHHQTSDRVVSTPCTARTYGLRPS